MTSKTAMIADSRKSEFSIWPFLLGATCLLLWVLLGEDKDEGERICSETPAAVLAANPDLKRSYVIEKAKKECIEQRICRAADLVGGLPCEFTAYTLKECKDLDPALADYKIARKHLEAQVETCELSKKVNRHGHTVYQWQEK